MSYQEHQNQSRGQIARCAIVTLSDTRTADTDTSGKKITSLLLEQSHSVIVTHLIKDDPAQLRELLEQLLASKEVDIILTNGGTGISRRDQTIRVIEEVIDLPLPGFGELFRMLSYQQIGSGAMLSRALGGIAKNKLLFAMPGSTNAVELAMTKLILPELGHLLREISKH